jgi:hypothetical protein
VVHTRYKSGSEVLLDVLVRVLKVYIAKIPRQDYPFLTKQEIRRGGDGGTR